MQNYLSGDYTQLLEKKMQDVINNEYDVDYDFGELLEKINSKDFLRSFSERLLAFYNDALGADYTENEAKLDLQKKVKKAGLPLSDGTIRNWFSNGTVPPHSYDSRMNIFSIAFSMELNYENTIKLFHKVYLDRAFNMRNEREFIYYYCIKNGKPFSIADTLISQLNNSTAIIEPTDKVELTQFLVDVVKNDDMCESDILQFLRTHQNNFKVNNTAAKKERQRLLDLLSIGNNENYGLAQMEFEKRKYELTNDREALVDRVLTKEKKIQYLMDNLNIKEQEQQVEMQCIIDDLRSDNINGDKNDGEVENIIKKHALREDEQRKKVLQEINCLHSGSGSERKDYNSIDFLLYMILGIDFRKKDDEIISIKKMFPQRKEIYSCFPNSQSLRDKEPESYELRKNIILLYFYMFWVNDYLSGHGVGKHNIFVDEMRDILNKCGFSPLYIGNPYDWLFLYCSACSEHEGYPLDVFRGILTPDNLVDNNEYQENMHN